MVRQVDEELLRLGRVKKGDLVVIIAGSPPGIPGSTNALRVHRMGDAINELAPAYRPDLQACQPIRRRSRARLRSRTTARSGRARPTPGRRRSPTSVGVPGPGDGVSRSH